MTDANELLRRWPGWSKANAERVLASPAWRLETRFGGSPARLVRVAALDDAASVVLDVRLDDDPHVMAVEPTPTFPDLELLRGRLASLPKEVLLALVEKECGLLFQFVEELAKRRLSVAGISGGPAPRTAFSVSGEAGEAKFAFDLTSEMEQRLGILANLDVGHPSVRGLTREAVACHGEWTMSDEEVASLSAGDVLVPEDGFAPRWLVDEPKEDEMARAVSGEKGVLTFAQIADDALPPMPEPAALSLVRRGRPLAALSPVRLGLAATAFRVDVVGDVMG